MRCTYTCWTLEQFTRLRGGSEGPVDEGPKTLWTRRKGVRVCAEVFFNQITQVLSTVDTVRL